MDTLNEVEFCTERLKLKILTPDFANIVLEFYERNKEHLEPWEPERDNEFYTLEYQQNLLSEQIDSFRNGRSLCLWIFDILDSGLLKVIGAVNFSNIILGPLQSCFVGYKLDYDSINQGYITEALVKGISIMFDGYKLHRIEANVIPRNERSLRVVEKLGFEYEGYSKKYLRINGIWEDHKRFAIINNIE